MSVLSFITAGLSAVFFIHYLAVAWENHKIETGEKAIKKAVTLLTIGVAAVLIGIYQPVLFIPLIAICVAWVLSPLFSNGKLTYFAKQSLRAGACIGFVAGLVLLAELVVK